MSYLFTSESVAIGHPDKICDQISDAILDACIAQDPFSRVACETLVTSSTVFIAGEITTNGRIDYEKVARETIREIGYTDPSLDFDYESCNVILSIHEQSPDIALGLTQEKRGAGDQGMMFGFACNDTPELMPLPISLAHKLVRELNEKRKSGALPFLKPDGKSQVTVEYNDHGTPLRVHTVVLSAQHAQEIDEPEVISNLKELIVNSIEGFDDQTLFYINPTGRFVLGGPVGDTGLTGRKTMVDTYGGMGHHGGGAFSGKDPTKVDRSGSYAGRYVAKNIVAAGLATKCEVQISYAIGVDHPISLYVNTFGTGTVPNSTITTLIPQVFDLSPVGILNILNLRRPIYKKTAFSGHFGREEEEFTWEKTDKAEILAKIAHL